jgi:hypothetical protein
MPATLLYLNPQPSTQTMSNPYTAYLVNIACDGHPRPVIPPNIEKPWDFLTSLFHEISDTAIPVTRTGMDTMMDAVFENPSFGPLLEDPVTYQTMFVTNGLLRTTPLFQSFWTHIILPAWNQHVDIRHAASATLL